jgi:hypothetical protein
MNTKGINPNSDNPNLKEVRRMNSAAQVRRSAAPIQILDLGFHSDFGDSEFGFDFVAFLRVPSCSFVSPFVPFVEFLMDLLRR